MKIRSLSPPAAAVAVFAAAVFAVTVVAQAPQAPSPEAGGPPRRMRSYPAPKNLKVLPKTFTGQQVHETMEGWAGSLGVHCDTCHAADPHNIGPNGRPRLKFEDDSKPEKSTARLMYKMTRDINDNYVSMVPVKEGAPTPKVTCGTCHRGHKDPEPYVIPREQGRGPEGMRRGPDGMPPPPQ